MLRYWGKAGFLQSPGWEPHAAGPVQYGVYASKWPNASTNATVYTIVNRSGKNLTGTQLRVGAISGTGSDAPSGGAGQDGQRYYYDCYHGMALTPTFGSGADGQGGQGGDGTNDQGGDGAGAATLAFDLEAGGFGCVVEQPLPAGQPLLAYLGVMQDMTARALHTYDAAWSVLPQTMVDLPHTKPPPGAVAAGMVHVPRANYTFTVKGVEIEGTDAVGEGEQYPWEDHPQRDHTHTLDIGPFYIDKSPATCGEYAAYLNATGYTPLDSTNWLTNWHGKLQPPEELVDVPVTYIGLAEARGYCAWAHGGSRLPHSYEWQYAAQGSDGRAYPWGNTKDQACYPVPHSGNTLPGAEKIGMRPARCDSPFGVSDLVGNVWQYTDAFEDLHTRVAVLRGGSNYVAGTGWYFPNALELNKQNRYLLMDNTYERSGTIGVRCLVDA